MRLGELLVRAEVIRSVASTEERGRDGLLYPVESQGLAEEVQ